MAHDETALRQAHDELYRALNARDLDAMTAVWVQEPWVECVHPGWPALRGWNAIRKSWQAIFQSPSRLAITVSDVRVRVLDTTALVTCVERIKSQQQEFLDTTLAQTVNVFVRRDDGWKLVHHQASTMPTTSPLAVPESDSIN